MKQISIDFTDDKNFVSNTNTSSIATPYGLIEINDLTEDSIVQEQDKLRAKTPFAEQKNAFFSSNEKFDTGVFNQQQLCGDDEVISHDF